MQALGGDGNLVGGSEQERAVNAEDGGVVGDVFVLQDVHAAVFDVLVGDFRDGGGGGDPADEQQRSQNHSRLDRYGEVGKDGEAEGHEPDADVGLG